MGGIRSTLISSSTEMPVSSQPQRYPHFIKLQSTFAARINAAAMAFTLRILLKVAGWLVSIDCRDVFFT